MANYATLIAAVQSVIAQNGNNEITGPILQQTLVSIINSLGTGYQFVGIATPSTTPGTPDQKVFYIGSAGTYPNFGPSVVPAGNLGVFYYDTSWHFGTIAFPLPEIVESNLASALVDKLFHDGYKVVGIATPETTPGTPTQYVAYIGGSGTYPNFGNVTIPDGYIGLLKYNGSWSLETVKVGKDFTNEIEQLTEDVDTIMEALGPVSSQEIPIATTWVQGSINISTGENVASTVTLRSGFITVVPPEKLRIVCASGYFIKWVGAYNSANLNDYYGQVFLSYDEDTQTWDTTKTDLTFETQGKVLRICVGKTNLGTIVVADGSNISQYRKTTSLDKTIVESIEDINEEISDILLTLDESGLFPEHVFTNADYNVINGIINVGTNKWQSFPSNYQSGLINVSSYRGKKLKIKSNGGYYSFLTSGFSDRQTPSYANGYSQPVAIAANTDYMVEIPDNAVYLYVQILNNGVNVKPQKVYVGLTLNERVTELEKNLSVNLQSAALIANKDGYFLGPNGAESTSSLYKTIEYVPVLQGDVFIYQGYVGSAGVCAVGYNASKSFVSVLLNYGDYSKDTAKITVPSGIAFVSFCGRVDTFPFNVSRYFGTYSIQDAANILARGASLAGKRIYAIGDSITEGVVVSGDRPAEPWPVIVSNVLSMVLTNYGISASTIAVADGNGGMFASLADLQAAQKVTGMYYTVLTGNQTYQVYYWNGSTLSTSTRKLRTPLAQRYQFMGNDADIILVAAGTNDFQYNWTPIGTMEDRTDATFYGALHVLCLGLLQKFLGKTIVFMTPIKRAQTQKDTSADTTAHQGGNYGTPESQNLFGLTLSDYCDIIKKVCAYYSIPVIDMYSCSLLNPSIASQSSLFDSYKTHPFQQGHEIMAKYVSGQLKAIIGF